MLILLRVDNELQDLRTILYSVGQLPDGRTTTLCVARGSPAILDHAGSFSLPNGLSLCNVCVCGTATDSRLLFFELLGQKQKLHGVVQKFCNY